MSEHHTAIYVTGLVLAILFICLRDAECFGSLRRELARWDWAVICAWGAVVLVGAASIGVIIVGLFT